MLTAVIGLVGALGGVVVGTLLTSSIENRRDERRLRDEVRVAARLVRDELQRNLDELRATSGLLEVAREDAWNAQKAVIARVIDQKGWDDVAAAYGACELAARGEQLNARTLVDMHRATIKLDGLLNWTRDEDSEDAVLYGYQQQLERLVGENVAKQQGE